MLRSALTVLASALAVPAAAQTPAAPPVARAPAPSAGAPMGPPPAFIEAAQGFGQCIGAGTQSADQSLTPEAAATAVLAACREQRTRVEGAFETWITSVQLTDLQRAAARARMRDGLAGAHAQIVAGIRQARGGAPAPTPSPAPKQ